jgi:glutathione S-transferase
MPAYHLSYFNGRGLGEVSRLIFAAAGAEFKESRFDISFIAGGAPPSFAAAFLALRESGGMPYGQVPTLTVDGGAPLAQSKAIERFLARELGLAGATPLDAARLDSVGEEVADIKTKFTAAKGDADKKAAFLAKDLPTMFSYIDKQLAAVGAPGVTLADVYLYHLITHWAGDDKAAFAAAGTPGVHAAVAKVAATAGVAAWEAARADRKEIF